MFASPKMMARRTAGPLLAAMLIAMPSISHAAPARLPATRSLASSMAAVPYLAGPLRVVAAFGTATSAWRSVEHNRRIGGVPNSYHLIGHAIDVQRRPGVTHRMVDAALRQAGYVLVESLDEIDHSHFAFLPGGVSPRLPRPPAPPVVVAEQKPVEPTIAADRHGTLLIDGEGLAAASPTPDPQRGSEPVLASAQ